MHTILAELDGLEPRERGKVFERRVVPWLLRNATVYRESLSGVWHWDDFRERHKWGPDTGIDLIAEESVTKRRWAIQAKAYLADSDLTWKDLSTFVGAAAARPEVDCLVLITTAGGVGATARRHLAACGKPVTILDRERLLDLGLPENATLRDLRQVKKSSRLKPRPHQAEAIRAAVRGFATERRGQVIHACGTGKTLTALWIKEALKSKRSVVFAPSLALVDQTLRVWRQHQRVPFSAVVVCSDPSVGLPGEDDAAATPIDLVVPPTTDAKHLRDTLRKLDGPMVVFATYHSADTLAAALAKTNITFDLMIADEAHRTAGVATGSFSLPLRDDGIPAARRLFLTATPRLYRQRSTPSKDGDQIDILSMDDRERYGPRFHTLTFREAISKGLLCDYRIVVLGVTPGEVEAMVARRAYVTPDGEDVMDAAELATHVAVVRIMRDFDVRRVLSFHTRVAGARAFAVRFPRVAQWMGRSEPLPRTIWAELVSGREPVRSRRQSLRRLQYIGQREWGMLTNARCLSEGVDVPEIDGVVFVDPKSSETDIVQAVGRAIRKATGKARVSTILLPIAIPDNEEDALRAVEGSDYQKLWRVLDALRSHDEVLAQQLDACRRKRAECRGQAVRSISDKLVLRLPTRVGKSFANALQLRLLERTTSSFEEAIERLSLYKQATGHCRVPQDFQNDDGYALGYWVQRQRRQLRDGLLPRDREERLKALDFAWDPHGEAFELGIGRLEVFASVHNHFNVPASFRDSAGYALGSWVSKQRFDYKSHSLSPERVERLTRPGFIWEAREASFEEGYSRLAAYKKRHGTCEVPALYREPDGYPLGQWVSVKRREWRGNGLRQDRRKRLTTLGMVWDVPAADFERGYASVAAYKATHGDCEVPQQYVDDTGFSLGVWINNRTRDRKRGKLSSEQVKRLDDIGLVWDRVEAAFGKGYERLVAFKRKHGHCDVPAGYQDDDGFALGAWLATRRSDRRSGDLAPERIRKLTVLGVEWEPLAAAFDEGLRRLRAYKKRYGDCNVDNDFRDNDGYALGSWLAVKRAERRRGKLLPEREAQLNALGVVWDPRMEGYEEGMARLVAYVKKHGHCNVLTHYKEPDGMALGAWVSLRRYERKRGTLSKDRIARLNAIGFIWSAAKARKK